VASGRPIPGKTRRGALRALAVACLCTALAGCGRSISGLPVETGGTPVPPRDAAHATTLQIRYLGAGGVLLTRGEDALLTAPFFSNPSISRLVFGQLGFVKFESSPDQIGRFLGPKDKEDLARVTAVLVGHAHYDHLMDVPYIKQHFLPNATIYGSDTMQHTLAGDKTLDRAKVKSLEPRAWLAPADGQPEAPAQWTPVGPRLRVLALKSEHAPILFGWWKFSPEAYDAPLESLPTRPWGWREGQTLAYLIDFLAADGKTVEFRVHYQDAASNPPFGFPPLFKGTPDERPVDVAILCVPGFNQVKNYPDGLIERINPRSVVLIHWENFFTPLPDDARALRVVPNTDVEAFLARLKRPGVRDARVTLPAPGAWLRYAP
jgi:L-ascorbate metabolism protein UlaG (beta-lactamase superfamily)